MQPSQFIFDLQDDEGLRSLSTSPDSSLSAAVTAEEFKFTFVRLHRDSQLHAGVVPTSQRQLTTDLQSLLLPSALCADVGTGQSSPNQLHRKVQYLNFSLAVWIGREWV